MSIFPVLLFSLLHAATYTKKVLDVSMIWCMIPLILLVFLGVINMFELQLWFPLARLEELEWNCSIESQHRESEKSFSGLLPAPPPCCLLLWLNDVLELTLITFLEMLFFEGSKSCVAVKLKFKTCLFKLNCSLWNLMFYLSSKITNCRVRLASKILASWTMVNELPCAA